MPMFPTVERKEAREPISHEVKPHNRPFDANKLSKPSLPVRTDRQKRWDKDYAEAQAKLAELPPGYAVQLMERLPAQLLECYLVAETFGQARKDILQRFPKPGPSAINRYIYQTDSTPKEQVASDSDEPVSKPKKKRAPARKAVPPAKESAVVAEVATDEENDNVEA